MYKILFATDGSDSANRALNKVIQLAVPLKAHITMLSVINQSNNHSHYADEQDTIEQLQKDYGDIVELKAREYLNKIAKPLQSQGLDVTTEVMAGDPAEVIAQLANKGQYNLVVVGRRGLSGSQRILLGSVSSKLLNISHTDILVVK